MRIVIIGTGNAATVLGRKLKGGGHTIVQVVGRNSSAASHLANELNAQSTNNWSAINRTADIYLLAVSDSAVCEVAQSLQVPEDALLVHTAASVSREVLKGKTARYGVFYPLQSLKKEVSHVPEIPLFIDASDEHTLQQLTALAHSVSGEVHVANDDTRLKLHLAAVMVNNFTNHLYALVEKYCEKEGLHFNLLQPLLLETVLRLKDVSPATTQTGPAVRHDTSTLEKHLALLEQQPQLKRIYKVFTESIQQSR
ncbi:MAG: DUF2520 domain-containing protein [Bacteroidota bacterium]|nr:DUF2520 domain-containing protein [Bacteroidota bacterium]